MLVAILTVLAFASALLTILASYQNRRLTLYLFKPLTILFIILIALQAKHPTTPFYRYAILAGLLFSLAGDIFLMLPEDRFIPGLVCFWIAHLIYVTGMTYQSGQTLPFLIIAPFVIYAGLILRALSPHLGKLRWPVVAYMLVIMMMGCTAVTRWALTKQSGSALAAFGAVLFIISDSLLAINKFKGHFRSAHFLILGTYFTAQCLIALST